MPYRILLSDDGGHVLVRASGSFGRDEALRAAAEAWDLARAHALDRFFYDLRLARNTESVLSNSEFVHAKMPTVALERHARVALLTAPDDRSHDFIATVSRNAGYNVELFTDPEAAAAWLNAR